MKKKRELEIICKGVANHRRIEILSLLDVQPGLSLGEISEKSGANLKTVAVHIAKMHRAGLVFKTSQGWNVRHTLSPRGKTFLIFLRKLE